VSATSTSTPASIHEPALAVLGRVRELLGLDEVLDGDQPGEAAFVVDQRQALELVLAQQRGGVLARDAGPARDEGLGRHDLGDLRRGPLGHRREAQVAVGHDADEPVVVGEHREPRDAVLARALVELLQRGVRTDRDGVGDDAGLRPLHQVDLVGLVLDRQVAVQDPESALTGHRDRHARLRHGVHRRGHERHLERDLARQARRRVDLRRGQLGVAGEEEDVVVGEPEEAEGVVLRGRGRHDTSLRSRAARYSRPGAPHGAHPTTASTSCSRPVNDLTRWTVAASV
jgi:hypothetical protein